MSSEFYRPRQAYEYDWETGQIVGRFLFIIGGEMADGTKCWYKCDEDGNILGDEFYFIHRSHGRMIAILEGV